MKAESVVVGKQSDIRTLVVDTNAISLKAYLEKADCIASVESGACLVAVNGTLVRNIEGIAVQSGDVVLVVPKVCGG